MPSRTDDASTYRSRPQCGHCTETSTHRAPSALTDDINDEAGEDLTWPQVGILLNLAAGLPAAPAPAAGNATELSKLVVQFDTNNGDTHKLLADIDHLLLASNPKERDAQLKNFTKDVYDRIGKGLTLDQAVTLVNLWTTL